MLTSQPHLQPRLRMFLYRLFCTGFRFVHKEQFAFTSWTRSKIWVNNVENRQCPLLKSMQLTFRRWVESLNACDNGRVEKHTYPVKRTSVGFAAMMLKILCLLDGKFHLVHVKNAYRGAVVQLHAFLTKALDEGEWLASRLRYFSLAKTTVIY